jgi:hypothetical protein
MLQYRIERIFIYCVFRHEETNIRDLEVSKKERIEAFVKRYN